MDLLAQRAIDEALRGNWKEAVHLNEEIVDNDPKNREALNRLARSLLELGKLKKAILTYKKVIKLDPYNTIAQKALKRLETIETVSTTFARVTGSPSLLTRANLFIEEPGKTKTVTLIHLGDNSIISSLDAGESVELSPHAHRVSVQTLDGHYIGRLPDDISRRIISFTRAGSEYQTLVRSVNPTCIKVFIREKVKAKTLQDSPSFPSTEKPDYISYAEPDLVHKERPDVSTHESEERI